jgi:hypothetical protein
VGSEMCIRDRSTQWPFCEGHLGSVCSVYDSGCFSGYSQSDSGFAILHCRLRG